MITRPLLVELFTEELPPKALPKLGLAFAEGLCAALNQHGLVASDNEIVPFATPRRLAVRLTRILDEAPEQTFSEKLMPVKVGLDASGAATPALLKKLAAKGWEHLDVSQLARESDGKQDYLVASGTAPGEIAAKYGKSETWLKRRMKLTGLTAKARDAWGEGENFSHYSTEMMEYIGTLPPAAHTNMFLVGGSTAVLIEPATPFEDELDAILLEDV